MYVEKHLKSNGFKETDIYSNLNEEMSSFSEDSDVDEFLKLEKHEMSHIRKTISKSEKLIKFRNKENRRNTRLNSKNNAALYTNKQVNENNKSNKNIDGITKTGTTHP